MQYFRLIFIFRPFLSDDIGSLQSDLREFHPVVFFQVILDQVENLREVATPERFLIDESRHDIEPCFRKGRDLLHQGYTPVRGRLEGFVDTELVANLDVRAGCEAGVMFKYICNAIDIVVP